LVAGEADPIDVARPFIRENKIYLCNAVPRKDLVIALPHVPELERIRVLRCACKIHELNLLSGDVLQASFRLPPAVKFEYLAGQYIRLTNRDRITRSYSLADAAYGDKLLRIHVRRVDGGAFSRYLFEKAKLGDLMHLEGPMGHFILQNSVRVRKTVFLATGTGIAPIHAILSSLNSELKGHCGELFLYWGNRRIGDAYFRTPMMTLAQRLGLKYFEVFSRSFGAETEPAPRHVQELMSAHHPNLADAQVFASGNSAMIDEGRKQALLLGLPASKFFADPFTAS
jgi:CDP-4-dehydro-6-deoxyglucose reductase